MYFQTQKIQVVNVQSSNELNIEEDETRSGKRKKCYQNHGSRHANDSLLSWYF